MAAAVRHTARMKINTVYWSAAGFIAIYAVWKLPIITCRALAGRCNPTLGKMQKIDTQMREIESVCQAKAMTWFLNYIHKHSLKWSLFSSSASIERRILLTRVRPGSTFLTQQWPFEIQLVVWSHLAFFLFFFHLTIVARAARMNMKTDDHSHKFHIETNTTQQPEN